MATTTAEEIRVGPLRIRFLLEGAASAGSVAVFEFHLPAGAPSPPAHSHDAYEETIYGLEGVSTWTVDGRRTDVGPGEALCIPRGVVHVFEKRTAHRVEAFGLVHGVYDGDQQRLRVALDRMLQLDLQDGPGVEPLDALKFLGEVGSIDEPGYEEEVPLVIPGRIDRDDMRVLNGDSRLDLTLESLPARHHVNLVISHSFQRIAEVR